MHVAEQLQAFWQLISSHHSVRLLDHVWSQIDKLVAKLLCNVSYFADGTLGGVEIGTEIVPVQHVFGLWSQLVITLTREAKHGLIAIVSIRWLELADIVDVLLGIFS